MVLTGMEQRLVAGASNAAMKAVLGKLVDFLSNEYALIRSARGDVQYIADELASMQAFLDNLDSSRTDHAVQTKDWMKQVRDIVYDTEDSVDEYAHRFPNDPRGDGCWSDFLRCLYDVACCCPRRDIAAKFAEIKIRVEQVAERRKRYGVSDPLVAGNNMAARTIRFHAAENQLDEHELVRIKEPVGMNNMEKLRDRFTNTEGKVVLSIWGFGGVGKTTIAMALYQEHEHMFDRRAIVTVSQSSDLEAILHNLLSQIKKANDQHQGGGGSSWYGCAFFKTRLSKKFHKQGVSDATTKELELGKELKERLQGKSYLLLIDDVWSTTTWHHIYNYLPDNTGESTIIMVTTRFQDVATKCYLDAKEGGIEHPVGVLPRGEAQKLFENVMSESTRSQQQQQDIKPPPRIWEVCQALPLAIVIMAGLVACNQDKLPGHWDGVREDMFPKSVEYLTQEEVTGMLLDYCFHDLSADLKNCTLYLSVFPKGCKISSKRLTRRWIAEGFVSGNQGLTAEDVADAYFKHLVRRKIIRPVEHNKNGKVKTCQTHDMVLEYLVSKSREDNFTTVVGGHWPAPVSNKRVRRLSIHNSDSKHAALADKMNLYRLRSLTVFGSAKHLPSYTFKVGLVQVLDLEDCKDFKKKNLDKICRMLLLKYLSLRRTNIDSIPASIGDLQYLETFDIRETNVTVLPKAIGQLKRLANILGGHKIRRKAFRLPEGLKKEAMRAMRILSGIEVAQGSSIVDDLREFTGLTKLVIYKLSIKDKTEVLRSAIQYLGGHFLRSLTIDDDCSSSLDSLSDLSAPPTSLLALELSGKLGKLPGWIKELRNLRKLTLSVTVLRTDTFELLRELPLFCLTFSFSSSKWEPDMESILQSNKSIPDGVITVKDGGFRSLNLLRFSAPLLPSLNFSEKAMPNLERLELRFKKFEGLIGMENLQKLKQVNLTVHVEANQTTKMKVSDLIRIAKECDTKPKVIRDEHEMKND